MKNSNSPIELDPAEQEAKATKIMGAPMKIDLANEQTLTLALLDKWRELLNSALYELSRTIDKATEEGEDADWNKIAGIMLDINRRVEISPMVVNAIEFHAADDSGLFNR